MGLCVFSIVIMAYHAMIEAPKFAKQLAIPENKIKAQVNREHALVADGKVHFLPCSDYMPHYTRHCRGWLAQNEKPTAEEQKAVVRRYTSGPGWWCSTINFGLAADHEDTLKMYS